MKILDKYIAKQIILAILVVALALLGFDLFFNLVHELKAVGKGQYTVAAALQYLVLTMPTRLYAMFPWAALMGTIISLGALANHCELVVMRAASISVGRIVWASLKGALVLIAIVILLGEGIAPMTERIALNKKTFALSNGQTIHTLYGLWVRQGQVFMHIQSVRDGELFGITRYQFDADRKLKAVTYAEKAVQEGNHWRLEHIRGTQFEPNKTKVITRDSEEVLNLLNPEILETATVKHLERLSLISLWRTIQNRSENALNTQSYEVALWTKLFQPLVIIMMVFLAAPFVFGPLRQVSMGFRVVVGILVAFLFHTINGFFTPLAVVYQFPPFLAVMLPIALFSGIGFWLLQRAK